MLDERHDTLTIRTPEGIVFSLALAGPARRFLAWGIDAAITTSAVLAVFAALAFGDLVRADLIRAAGIISFFAIKLTYVILSEWFWRGQTLGKFVLGLRVMDVQGLRLHFNQIVLRNLMRILDAMPFFYLAGGLSMLFSRRCQRLGDLAANTVVVARHTQRLPDFTRVAPGRYNSLRAYPHIEARLRQRVSQEEAMLAMRALLRREELEPQSRLELYAELAAHFRRLAPFPEEATIGLTDEQYLRNVVESLYKAD